MCCAKGTPTGDVANSVAIATVSKALRLRQSTKCCTRATVSAYHAPVVTISMMVATMIANASSLSLDDHIDDGEDDTNVCSQAEHV